MLFLNPPHTLDELIKRARDLSGKTLSELSVLAGEKAPPDNLKQAKGWIGQLIERHLGAFGGSLPRVDFPNLGIELKTIPCDGQGRPKESTFVCSVVYPLSGPSSGMKEMDWDNSLVKRKLSHVLWVPVIDAGGEDKHIIAKRRVGNPHLWEMDLETENILKQDWEELMELLSFGKFASISARIGRYLQLRPKAAHSRILRPQINEASELSLTCPKGFYLRTLFTRQLLKSFYL